MQWYNAIHERNNLIKEQLLEEETRPYSRHTRGSSIDMTRTTNHYYSGDEEQEDDDDNLSYYYDPDTQEYYAVEKDEDGDEDILYPIVDEVDEDGDYINDPEDQYS